MGCILSIICLFVLGRCLPDLAVSGDLGEGAKHALTFASHFLTLWEVLQEAFHKGICLCGIGVFVSERFSLWLALAHRQ